MTCLDCYFTNLRNNNID